MQESTKICTNYKLNQMKLKPGLGTFYAIIPGTGFCLFYSFHGPQCTGSYIKLYAGKLIYVDLLLNSL